LDKISKIIQNYPKIVPKCSATIRKKIIKNLKIIPKLSEKCSKIIQIVPKRSKIFFKNPKLSATCSKIYPKFQNH